MKIPVSLAIAMLMSTSTALAFPANAPYRAFVSSDIVANVPQVVFRDIGNAPVGNILKIAITLRYRNSAQLDQIVELQSEKGSPLYRHWLSNEQFDAAFAPAPGDYVRAMRSLQRAGLRVTAAYANRTVIDAAGPVGAIERYFGTDIHRVVQPGSSGARYVNVSPAHAPIDLGDLVLSVDGLSTLAVVKTFHETVRGHAPGSARRPDAVGGPLYGPANTGNGLFGYGPLAFAEGYDFPVQHKSTTGTPYDGRTRKSGILIDADFLESDLLGFLQYFGISRTGPATTRVAIDGGPLPSAASAGAPEATLDAEALVGDAPGTAVYMYEIPQLATNNITDGYNKAVSDNLVDTLNSSFGGLEPQIGFTTAKAWDAIAEQGAAKGITFHASTGDEGGGLADAPATCPHFVAVGGTTLNVDTGGKWAMETGWSGSTGAFSHVFPLPKWQQGVHGMVTTGRNIPDVAFDADPLTGMALYFGGSFNNQYDPVGGTSLASPILGAAIAEIDQIKGGRMGLAGEALFNLWKKDGYKKGTALYFHDITIGNNGVYYDVPGYDLVTGIGSVDFWNVAQEL